MLHKLQEIRPYILVKRARKAVKSVNLHKLRHQTSPRNVGSFLFPECNRAGSIFTYIWLSVVVNVGTVSIPYKDPMGIYASSSGKAHDDELFSP